MAYSSWPFTLVEIERDPVLKGMIRDKLPLTRENYIIRNWGEMPEEWSAEHEGELPEKLQHGYDPDEGDD